MVAALGLAAAGWLAAEEIYAGSAACAPCHQAISRSYGATPMARSSGRPAAGPFRESFAANVVFQVAPGVRYRVFQEDGGYAFAFAKERMPIRGERRLDYFIGSGAAGRSYAFSVEGFLFQAPVSYYSQPARWDLSPGYERDQTLNLARPITPECLECHASRLQPVPGAANRYQQPPFLEGGIGCERCHGPGRQHLASPQAAGMVNPARLEPGRRDSVCAQCHLTGAARVLKAGRSLATFRPGDPLWNHVVSLVWAGGGPSDLKVTSHFEKLWQSRCKKASGDRLWCGSCHEAHRQPAPAERAAYYRSKCLGCHQAPDCKGGGGPDCAGCHMPKDPVVDAQHTVYTDHSIPRRPLPPSVRTSASSASPGRAPGALAAFWGPAPEARDLGLAWYRLAIEQDQEGSFTRARDQLERAKPTDAAGLVPLAFLHERRGNEERARSLYERAHRADPSQVEAAANLGAILLRRGRLAEAIPLLEEALSRQPSLEAAALNLAQARLRGGDPAGAERALRQILEHHPDSANTWMLLSGLRRATR